MLRNNKVKLMLFVAFTQLKDKKTQTLVATGGVAFGIAIFIFLLSCVKGINDYITELSLDQYPDIRLFNDMQVSENSVLSKFLPGQPTVLHHAKPKASLPYLKDGLIASREMAKNPNVKAVSPTLKAAIFFHVGSIKVSGEIVGIDYGMENTFFDLDRKIIGGDPHKLDYVANAVVMGYKLAEKFNLAIGDRIGLTSVEGVTYTATLVAILKTGIPEKDKTLCYGSLKTVQNSLQLPASYVSEISIKLLDRSDAPQFALQFANSYGCKSSNWLADNPFLFEGEKMNRIIFYGIAGSILLVAGFGIFNILNMMIYEKMKDIAIIKAIGFLDLDIRAIFMIQALSIGGAGALLGLLTGLLLSWLMTFVPYTSDLFISLDHFPMRFNLNYYIIGFFFGVFTTAVAGYMPSRKAAQLDPIAILRG
ncbi:ABC transporter permease [Sphingobacterium sp. Mn56C]|uniref:ABC transporter permease n=1 Tax=Sphingobacterium sp. Mn56C TaxID=3395261 RepID=UPI003BD01E1D